MPAHVFLCFMHDAREATHIAIIINQSKTVTKYNFGLSILFFRRMTLDDDIEPESKFVCKHYLKDRFLIFLLQR